MNTHLLLIELFSYYNSSLEYFTVLYRLNSKTIKWLRSFYTKQINEDEITRKKSDISHVHIWLLNIFVILLKTRDIIGIRVQKKYQNPVEKLPNYRVPELKFQSTHHSAMQWLDPKWCDNAIHKRAINTGFCLSLLFNSMMIYLYNWRCFRIV